MPNNHRVPATRFPAASAAIHYAMHGARVRLTYSIFSQICRKRIYSAELPSKVSGHCEADVVAQNQISTGEPPFASGMPASVLPRLEGIFASQRYTAGSLIFSEGDAVDRV